MPLQKLFIPNIREKVNLFYTTFEIGWNANLELVSANQSDPFRHRPGDLFDRSTKIFVVPYVVKVPAKVFPVVHSSLQKTVVS